VVTRAFRFLGVGAACSSLRGAGIWTGAAEARTTGAGTVAGLVGRWFAGVGSADADDARIRAAAAAIAVERPVMVTTQLWKRTP